MWWIRLINFFSAFCPRHTHFSSQTFLSRAYEKVSLCVWKKEIESQRGSLIFLGFWQYSRRGPSGFRICAGEPPFGRLPHRSATLRAPPAAAHLHVAPRVPKWPTWHATGTKENFIYHPPRETGSPSPAMLSQREKKRAEGLFLRKSFILSTSRFMSALAYWHARGFSTVA